MTDVSAEQRFTLTNTGVDLLRAHPGVLFNDFAFKKDGERWVAYHYARKPAVAVFNGGTSAEASIALKVFLITRRLTK